MIEVSGFLCVLILPIVLVHFLMQAIFTVAFNWIRRRIAQHRMGSSTG